MRQVQRISLLFLSVLCFRQLSAQNVIPYPLQMETSAGVFNLTSSSAILYSANCRQEAMFLRDLLDKESHFQVPVAVYKAPAKAGSIELVVDATLSAQQ